MKIVDVKTLQECVDGVTIKDYYTDRSVELPDIHRFAVGGNLEYFSFARPFYRINVNNCYTLKGVEGNSSIQALFANYRPELEAELRQRVEHEPD